ncbi:alginate export family protein [Hymenobacter terrenus]|uniref:alginate export family protein n=1 Tax=Hymenobacter terrenus TaxID=1629124 RepID=UPI000A62D73B|nr:alginate export family protein [Hymenobacter terrenus]
MLLTLGLSAGVARSSQAQTADSAVVKATPSPVYLPLRYEEDYAYLHDPARRTAALDGLKFIGLNSSATRYLTLGGEVRLRYQYYRNENWGLGSARDNSNMLQRYMLHADLHLGPYVRLFGQLKSSWQNGRTGGPGPLDEDRLAVGQAFADAVLPLRHDGSLTVRAGRQELYYGNGKLVEPREGPNIRLSFDAVRLLLRLQQWRVDGFVAQPVFNFPGLNDDRRNRQQTFWGLYTTGPLSRLIGGASLDVYYIGLHNDQIAYAKGAGPETRHTLGFRLAGRRQGWDYDTENFYQLGSFAGGSVRAWALTGDVGYTYTLRWGRRTGRFSLGVAVSSGDRGHSETTLRTMNPLYPTGYYFGPPATFLGPSNTIGLRPTVTLKPNQALTLAFSGNLLWRTSPHDGLYTPAATLLLTGQTSDSRYVGAQGSLVGFYQVQRHLTLSLLAAYFRTGRLLEAITPGRDVAYVSPGITFVF